MIEKRLAEIEERRNRIKGLQEMCVDMRTLVRGDIPFLMAEVRRLQKLALELVGDDIIDDH